MAGHHAGDLPGRPAGPVSTCSVPGAPRHRPAPRPQRPCRPPGHGGAAAGTPAKRRPWAAVDLVPASHGHRRTIPFPSGPMPAGDHAAHRPRRHVDPCARPGRPVTEPPGVQRGADSATAAPRTPEPVRPDTWRPRTPGHRTPDTGHLDAGGPLDRLDGHPTADRTRRTGQRPAWPASGHPRTGHTRWAASEAEHQQPRRSGDPIAASTTKTHATPLSTARTDGLPSATAKPM